MMVNLLNLPLELLESTCRQFCPHCNREGVDSSGFIDPDSESTRDGLSALRCLAQTNTTLRDLAQPILHHSSLASKNKFVPLLRTLCRRPDLAQLVRELHVVDQSVTKLETTVSAEDVALFSSLLQKFSSKPEDIDYNLEHGLLSLALTLVPKLQHLSVSMVWKSNNPKPNFCQPGSLPALTKLRVTPCHIELGTLMCSDLVYGILTAAPTLKSFSGQMLGSPTIHHASLTDIYLWDSFLTAKGFRHVMRGCPSLERFFYRTNESSVLYFEANPREVAKAANPRRQTLKTLRVHLHGELDAYFEEDLMGSLEHMEVLENLEINCGLIFGDLDDPQDDGIGEVDPERSPQAALLFRLPPSIRVITIYCDHVHLFQRLIRFAMIAPRQYPRLTTVRLVGSKFEKHRRGVLERAYFGTGVILDFIEERLVDSRQWTCG